MVTGFTDHRIGTIVLTSLSKSEPNVYGALTLKFTILGGFTFPIFHPNKLTGQRLQLLKNSSWNTVQQTGDKVPPQPSTASPKGGAQCRPSYLRA